jgi:hypothetical protein
MQASIVLNCPTEQVVILWVLMPGNLADGYQHFGGMYHLHFLGIILFLCVRIYI